MCGPTSEHKKYMSLKEIGLNVQFFLIILGSLVNIIDGTCTIVNKQENIHFDNE